MGLFKNRKKRDRASKQYMIAAWVVLAILLIMSYFFLRNHKQRLKIHSAGSVSSVQVPREKSKGYTGPSSPQFNKDLIEKGRRDAKKALQNGKSHIAPMTNGEAEPPKDQFDILKKANRFEKKKPEPITSKPVQKLEEPKKTAKAAPERDARPSKAVRVDQRNIDTIRNSLNAQLAMISRKMVYKDHAAMTYKPVESTEQNQDKIKAKSKSKTTDSSKTTAYNMKKTLGIMPGDVFYASNMQTINTDTPAPVATVQILSGPLKDSVAQGTFELKGDNIRFVFNQLTDKEGNAYKMRGFAVHPTTHFAGVASEVDHHYLERWGGVIAASLLRGYADAVKTSGSSTTASTSSGLITSEKPRYSFSEKFWIASGDVADTLSDVAKAQFNREVTAWLNSNAPVGVLIINLIPIK